MRPEVEGELDAITKWLTYWRGALFESGVSPVGFAFVGALGLGLLSAEGATQPRIWPFGSVFLSCSVS